MDKWDDNLEPVPGGQPIVGQSIRIKKVGRKEVWGKKGLSPSGLKCATKKRFKVYHLREWF